jgi:hypothetical protein
MQIDAEDRDERPAALAWDIEDLLVASAVV